MSDIKELKDEELEKVSDGIEYSISRVDAGDVSLIENLMMKVML